MGSASRAGSSFRRFPGSARIRLDRLNGLFGAGAASVMGAPARGTVQETQRRRLDPGLLLLFRLRLCLCGRALAFLHQVVAGEGTGQDTALPVQVQTQLVGHLAQLHSCQLRAGLFGETGQIGHLNLALKALLFQHGPDKAQRVGRVVHRHHRIQQQIGQTSGQLLVAGGAHHVLVVNTGDRAGFHPDGNAGIDKRAGLIGHLVVRNAHHTVFQNAVHRGVMPGGLHIQDEIILDLTEFLRIGDPCETYHIYSPPAVPPAGCRGTRLHEKSPPKIRRVHSIA